MWISDVGDELEGLPAISKLFAISDNLAPNDIGRIASGEAAKSDDAKADAKDGEKKTDEKDSKTGDSATAEADAAPVPVGWHPLRFRRGIPEGQVVTFQDQRTGMPQTVRDPERIARMRQDPNFVATEEHIDETAITSPERKFAPDSSAWFVEQRMGLGTVRAFRGANEVADFAQTPPIGNQNMVSNGGAADELPRSLAVGLRRTERWDARHGMTPDTANAEFVKFLVPGVGLAPVTEFEILITVFVLVIGPLNYWILKRYKRLHLMVLTVPLAAALTTLALFGYAVVADGFATRVRAQSFTTLDQRSGEAACWSRLSYYSGLAPGKGLVMPTDVGCIRFSPDGPTMTMRSRSAAWLGR